MFEAESLFESVERSAGAGSSMDRVVMDELLCDPEWVSSMPKSGRGQNRAGGDGLFMVW